MNNGMKAAVAVLALLGGLSAGGAGAAVTLDVAPAGTGSGVTAVSLPLTATRTEGSARMMCGTAQDSLSERVVLGGGRWVLTSLGGTGLTAGQAARGQLGVQGAATGGHDRDSLDADLYCQLRNEAGEAASAMVPVRLHIHAVASPAVTLSTATLDLGTCSPNRHETLTGQLGVTTGVSGDYPVSTETLRASVTGGGDTAGTVQVLDENDADLVLQAADIRQTASGEHALRLRIPCPSEPGRYQWRVVVTHEIE